MTAATPNAYIGPRGLWGDHMAGTWVRRGTGTGRRRAAGCPGRAGRRGRPGGGPRLHRPRRGRDDHRWPHPGAAEPAVRADRGGAGRHGRLTGAGRAGPAGPLRRGRAGDGHRVVVVVDSSSASAPAADGVRAATAALLQGLAAPTRVAVLSTGDAPTVVQPLVRGPRAALPALAGLAPRGANDLVDTLLAGIRLLPAVPGRQQQVVVVAAGADSGSVSSWGAARELLVRRGVALDVVDLGGSPSLPRAGAQCPGAVEAAGAAGAARTLAQQLQDRRLVVVPTLTGTSPVQVSVTHAGAAASTTLTTRADAAAGSAPEASEHRGGAGAGTLVLAFLGGDPRAARPPARAGGAVGARRCGAGSGARAA